MRAALAVGRPIGAAGTAVNPLALAKIGAAAVLRLPNLFGPDGEGVLGQALVALGRSPPTSLSVS